MKAPEKVRPSALFCTLKFAETEENQPVLPSTNEVPRRELRVNDSTQKTL